MRTPEVNKNGAVSLYSQVAAEIRRAIAVADVLGVNKNTVIRALHILRDEGLLDFTRGRGVRVVGTPQQSAVLVRISELLDFARQQGYRSDEVIAIIQAQS